MDFRLSDDQRALRAGVRELLARRFGRERLRAAVDPPRTADAAGGPRRAAGAAGGPPRAAGAAGDPSWTAGAADGPSRAAGVPGGPSRAADAAGDPSRTAGAAGDPSRAAGAAGGAPWAVKAADGPSRTAGAAQGPRRAAGAVEGAPRTPGAADGPSRTPGVVGGPGSGSRPGGRGSTPAPAPVLDRALWRELGEAGFFALRLPRARGGVGLGLPEAVLVFEEAGRALLPGPLVATHLAAGEVPGAATGECVVAAVDGTLVEWLEEADVVRGDVTGAVALRPVDPLTPLHRVDRAAPPDPVAVLLTAAEQLGSAARTCALAVQHARTREQFGQPIGAFQAVKHLCAEMLVRVEVARSAVYAVAVTGDPPDIAAARLLADEAAERGARDCLQVHGGMGFTWESEVHLHLKRAWCRARRGPCAAQTEEALAEDLLAPEERSEERPEA